MRGDPMRGLPWRGLPYVGLRCRRAERPMAVPGLLSVPPYLPPPPIPPPAPLSLSLSGDVSLFSENLEERRFMREPLLMGALLGRLCTRKCVPAASGRSSRSGHLLTMPRSSMYLQEKEKERKEKGREGKRREGKEREGKRREWHVIM